MAVIDGDTYDSESRNAYRQHELVTGFDDTVEINWGTSLGTLTKDVGWSKVHFENGQISQSGGMSIILMRISFLSSPMKNGVDIWALSQLAR